jgi:hypothetical protein
MTRGTLGGGTNVRIRADRPNDDLTGSADAQPAVRCRRTTHERLSTDLEEHR